MDIFKAISDLTTLPGVTGNEAAVSRAVQGYFRAHTDDVWIDAMGQHLRPHRATRTARRCSSWRTWTRSA